MASIIVEQEQLIGALSRDERWQKGKTLTKEIPWKSHAHWKRTKGSQNPISLIQENDKGRLSFLLPIKYGRMATSSFAFFRGSAVVMATDLSNTPVSGITTMLCGDAHLSNFGIFASPERKLIFDINDFDECYPGPWEWDLKRLAVSAVLAGKQNGFKAEDNRKLAKRVAKKYRKSITSFAGMPTLDVWYYSIDMENSVKTSSASKKGLSILKKTLNKARNSTTEQTLEKLTETAHGRRQFINAPPLTIRTTELLKSDLLIDDEKFKVSQNDLEKAWLEYVSSVTADRRKLLGRYHIVDTALRVVGVGSVGTRCFISLLEANSAEDAIILQQKEAGPSVLERFLLKEEFPNNAERVVSGQRLMQSASDIFLGRSRSPISAERDYYWRQLKDMKGSIEVSLLDKDSLGKYLAACSNCLAHAHARSGDAVEIAGYLDDGLEFDKAIADFSVAYAEQAERDYQGFLDAIKDGRIVAQKESK